MNKKNHMRLSFICLVNFLVISSSYAEVKSDAQIAEEILTQSELFECQNNTKSLAQAAQQLKERSEQLMTEKINISELEFNREQMYSGIDFHSQASVDKYNHLNNQIKRLSQTYTADSESYNNAVKQYKTDVERHLLECDNKRYYEQ
ncbi:MAG: hypothetical protein KAI22_09195 [Gammaproteobacteria bacterium]|nr:hypothetical protein [Gammaproteobacteria bacterium]